MLAITLASVRWRDLLSCAVPGRVGACWTPVARRETGSTVTLDMLSARIYNDDVAFVEQANAEAAV